MGADQEDTFSRLTACREIIFRLVREHDGMVANTAGDAVLAQFGSVHQAVRAALDIQKSLAKANATIPPDRQMHFRIGINLGDVIELEGDIFGDGVNVAARIQSFADPAGIMVSESVHDQIKGSADIRSELVGEQKVKNIDRAVRIYKILTDFIAAPSTLKAGPGTTSGASGNPERPEVTLGVFPFDNMSEDAEQSYFCDGLVEDLTTAIAGIPELKVVARNTMYSLKGKSVDIRQLGRDVGASHIVEGSVRKSGNRIRINAQLIETADGNHLWAGRYDKELSDLFQVQDDIVRSIVTELDVRLAHGEQARAWRASAKSPEAYDLFLHAGNLASAVNPQSFQGAVDLLNRALAIDPTFVAALTRKSWILAYQGQLGLVSDRVEALRQARSAVEAALQLDSSSGDAHIGYGLILMLAGQLKEAEKEFEHGLSLGPTQAELYISYASFCMKKREYQKALAAIRRAKELSRFGLGIWIGMEAGALSALGRWEEAFAIVKRAVERYPTGIEIWASYAQLSSFFKLPEEFKAARERILELQPDFSPSRYFRGMGFLDEELTTRIVERFRNAGWPS
jgi:adenylate cyclase